MASNKRMYPPVHEPCSQEIQSAHLTTKVNASLTGEIHEMSCKKIALLVHNRFRNEPSSHFALIFRDVEDAGKRI